MHSKQRPYRAFMAVVSSSPALQRTRQHGHPSDWRSAGKYLLACLALTVAITGLPAYAADLKVTVNYPTNSAGRIFVALFDNAKAFSDDRPLETRVSDTRGGSISLDFAGLKPGNYAVSTFLDENGNGKLDTNFVGIPTEGYGFSNDAMGVLGPPDFEAAVVPLSNETRQIVINLR